MRFPINKLLQNKMKYDITTKINLYCDEKTCDCNVIVNIMKDFIDDQIFRS